MRRSHFPAGTHLLKQINGKRTEAIEDPPVSSGDDSSQSARGKRKSRGRGLVDIEGSGDDDSDGMANISMERTTFEKADKSDKASLKKGRHVASASSSSWRKDTDSSGSKRRKLSSDEDDDERAYGKENKKEESRRKEKNNDRRGSKEATSSALSKGPKSPPSSSLKVFGSQDSVFNDKRHKKPTLTYRSSQEKGSGKATFKRVPPVPSPKKRKSKDHAAEDQQRSSRYSHPGTESSGKRTEFKSFPSEDKLLSPRKKPTEFKFIKDPEPSNTDSPSATTFKTFSENDEPSQASSQGSSQTTRVTPKKSAQFGARFGGGGGRTLLKPKKTKTKAQLRREKEEEEDRMPKAVFKTFDFHDTEFASGDPELSEVFSDLEDPSEDKTDNGDGSIPDDNEEFPEPVAVCPWCGDEVDDQLLKDFSKGQRMNVRLQTKFCRTHKKHTALETWREKGWPETDWDDMPTRIESHYDSLLKIVDGHESHYRKLLADKIEAGEDRSLKKEGDFTPGYYGPRGLHLMGEHLVHRFQKLLKQRAIKDRVISGRGPAIFIQAVLVAELAVYLIMDDMPHLDYEEAREVMEESKAIGEIVNGDP